MDNLLSELDYLTDKQKIDLLLKIVKERNMTILNLESELNELKNYKKNIEENKDFFNNPLYENISDLSKIKKKLEQELLDNIEKEKRYNKKFNIIKNDDMSGMQRKIAIRKALNKIQKNKKDIESELRRIKSKISKAIIF